MERTAVILAGGKSRRMGMDKAQLPFGKENLLEYQIHRYQSAGFTVLVSGHIAPPGIHTVADRFPGQGPLAGLQAAFLESEAEMLFLTAVDLPAVDMAFAELLFENIDKEDACLFCHASGQLEPLFALYRRSCLPVATAMLQIGERRMMDFLSQLQLHCLNITQFGGSPLENAFSANLNTKAFYHQFCLGN